MKNQLFIAMMLMASLLFIATGVSARGPSLISLQPEKQELTPAASGEREGAGEFILAVPATQEGIGEMMPAGAAGMTGLKDAHKNAAQFTKGHELCGYCSVFERAGFP